MFIPCVSTECTRIFILMSSPLIVPRNESRTFRVCAFPSSRSLSPSTFFYHSPASTLFIVSLTRTPARRITDIVSSRLTATAVAHHSYSPSSSSSSSSSSSRMEILLFLATPMSLTRGALYLPAYAYKCTWGRIYVSTYAAWRGAGEARRGRREERAGEARGAGKGTGRVEKRGRR